MTTDAEIIRSCTDDPRAFETLFDRHYDPIRGYLVRRVGLDDGEELAAEVFTTAFTHLHRYDLDRPNARPWLYGIATNLLRHHLRSAARGRVAFARAASPNGNDGGFDDATERVTANAEAARALRIIDGLEEGDRNVMLLVLWEGLAYAEVAEALGVPIGTVRSRLHRARRQVREQLAQRDTVTGRPRHA